MHKDPRVACSSSAPARRPQPRTPSGDQARARDGLPNTTGSGQTCTKGPGHGSCSKNALSKRGTSPMHQQSRGTTYQCHGHEKGVCAGHEMSKRPTGRIRNQNAEPRAPPPHVPLFRWPTAVQTCWPSASKKLETRELSSSRNLRLAWSCQHVYYRCVLISRHMHLA